MVLVHRDLKTILAGVAAAGNKTGHRLGSTTRAAVDLKAAAAHEHQLIDGGAKALQRCGRLRTLQRQQA